MLRKAKKFESYKGWCKGSVCVDKVNTVSHWDCEGNDCDECACEFIYETFITDWNITIPEPDDDEEEEVEFPLSYYEKFKSVNETTGKLEDQEVYKTDFLSFEKFLDRYIYTIFSNVIFKNGIFFMNFLLIC